MPDFVAESSLSQENISIISMTIILHYVYSTVSLYLVLLNQTAYFSSSDPKKTRGQQVSQLISVARHAAYRMAFHARVGWDNSQAN